MLQVIAFWVDTMPYVAMCDLPEDGGNMVLQNSGILTHQYMVSQPRSQLEFSSLWKPQISNSNANFDPFSK
jgi:hypothetical protein